MFFKIKQKLIRSLICPEFLFKRKTSKCSKTGKKPELKGKSCLNAKPQSVIKQALIATTQIPQNLQSINTVEELTGECTFAL